MHLNGQGAQEVDSLSIYYLLGIVFYHINQTSSVEIYIALPSLKRAYFIILTAVFVLYV